MLFFLIRGKICTIFHLVRPIREQRKGEEREKGKENRTRLYGTDVAGRIFDQLGFVST